MKSIPPKLSLAKLWRSPRREGTREGLELMDRNERTADFPPEVISKLRELVTPFLLRAYPEPEKLYQKLVQWLAVPREWILLTMGADGGLRSVFETFVEPGDEVVSVSPSYAMIPVYCGLSGAVARPVPFNEDLSLPLERILDEITDKTKVVLLANPNQPIERVYSETECQTLLEKCLRHEALLVMDEAYHHFCDVTALPSIKRYGNLIVARTFSKAFGIAGVRLGYLVSQPENIWNLSKVRPMYETHSLAIAIGTYLLENDHLMKSYVGEVKESVRFLRSALQGLGLPAYGKWSNSVLVAFPFEIPALQIGRALREQGFLVRVETTAPLSNHLRITVGTMEQTSRFLHLFEKIVANCKAHPVS